LEAFTGFGAKGGSREPGLSLGEARALNLRVGGCLLEAGSPDFKELGGGQGLANPVKC
jgi:hypothetical protein